LNKLKTNKCSAEEKMITNAQVDIAINDILRILQPIKDTYDAKNRDWISVTDELPNTDRTVQVQYEDGSVDTAFYDSVSGMTDKKVWWIHPTMQRGYDAIIVAWKEKERL
jgi:hypothetical protein